MTRLPFSQVDVFGGSAFRGNPVAVVHDADGLTSEQMQQIARWTNLSETTFLLTPTVPGAHYRLRIFTGSGELPFAGHPTLGSAHAWLQAHSGGWPDTVVQECGVGAVTLRRGDHGLEFAAPPMINTGPVDDETVAEIAGQLRVPVADIRAARVIDNGPGWIGVLLPSAEAVLAVDTPQLSHNIGLVGRYPDPEPYAVEVRAFFPSRGSTAEDPVTGSLNAAVAQWLLDTGQLTAPYVAHQGTAVGADGVITVDRAADGTVWVGGRTRTGVDGRIAV